MTFIDALVFLAVAVVMVRIASLLGLGSVLGYLAGGCIVGPYALGLVTDTHAIATMGEFGVVLMLFIIGLELDLSRLWAMRRQLFGGGLLQVLWCRTF